MINIDLQKIKTLEENDFYGKYSISPLNKGYGYTVGNTLRRILLSSLRGAAVTSIKIDNINHEYSTIDGVHEDVMNIILNVKNLKLISRSEEPQTVTITASGEKIVRASDIDVTDSIEVRNPEQIVATLSDPKAKLSIELVIENSYGYRLLDNSKRNYAGIIPIDADFSPVSRVNFTITNTRVGDETDLDEIILEIYTKSISPSVALKAALIEAHLVFNQLNSEFEPVSVEKEIKKTKVKPEKPTKKVVSKKTVLKKDQDETPKKSKKTK